MCGTGQWVCGGMFGTVRAWQRNRLDKTAQGRMAETLRDSDEYSGILRSVLLARGRVTSQLIPMIRHVWATSEEKDALTTQHKASERRTDLWSLVGVVAGARMRCGADLSIRPVSLPKTGNAGKGGVNKGHS